MVQRTRLRGTPLTAAEIREIHDHAAKQQEATGAVNKSKLQREISFKVERETIREALAMPRPEADAEPVHETRTEPVSETQPVIESIVSDRARLRLESQVKDLDEKYKEALRQIEETETRFDNLVAIKQPITPQKIEANTKHERGEAVAIVQASDWHVEESVEPATVNGLNKYNLEIAQRRAENYFRNVLKLVRKERQDVAIDTLVLHLGGDIISNYLHPELEESNNLSPIEAIRFAKELFVSGLRLWRDDGEFQRIQVVTSYGNHGRLTHKPRFSTGHKNNLEWMAYRDLAMMFDKDSVVHFQVEDGYFNYLEVFDKTLRFHHGDAIKYGGGIGGLSIPLIKSIHRANQQRYADADFCGHFHQLMPYNRIGKFVINGSLIGFNAYALRIGASPEPPLQSFHLLDSKRGFTISAPIIVEDEISRPVKASSTGWRQAA